MFSIDYREIEKAKEQIFYNHCEKAGNVGSSLGFRACHFFLAGIAYPPVIGDIVALFELLVVKVISKFKEIIPAKIEDKKFTHANFLFPIAKCIGFISLVGISIFAVGISIFAINYFSKRSLKSPGGMYCLVNQLDFCRKKHTSPFFGLIESEGYLKCRQLAFYMENPFGRIKFP